MNQIINLVILAVLFFLLSPNILLRIPKNGSKFVVAGVHALVFAVLYYVVSILLKRLSILRDGFTDETCANGDNQDGGAYSLDENGNCNPIVKDQNIKDQKKEGETETDESTY